MLLNLDLHFTLKSAVSPKSKENIPNKNKTRVIYIYTLNAVVQTAKLNKPLGT